MIHNEQLSLEKFVQSEGNIVSSMDGEMVMLNIEKGKYYNLGAVGGDIWGFIKEPASIDEIVDHLLAGYLIERSECEEQVGSFLQQLAAEGLVQKVEQ